MTTKKLLVLLIFVNVFIKADEAYSQTYSQGDSLAIFYPNNFDSTGTLPSLAIINEPIVTPGLPANWSLVPDFYIDDILIASCAKIDIGKNVDLYGTGEVTGPLRRNNTEINLWNTDNFRYQIDNGKELYQSHPWVMGVRADGSSFGIIADNTWRMNIKLSDSVVNFNSFGPPFRIIIFEAKTPQALLETLGTLTGKMELPPLWALGYHQSRCSYAPSTYVEDIASTFR
jgi:alpha-glucosidase